MDNDKTTARSTTEQPETDERNKPSPDKNHSGRRNKINQSLEEMKRQYNYGGDVDRYKPDEV